MSLKSKPQKRKRFNRYVKVLSEIYDIDYKYTMRIYNSFMRDIDVVKIHLNRIQKAQHELDFIDTINLNF